MFTLLKKHYIFTLSFGLILLQFALFLFISHRAGPDRQWLGDYVWNTSDQAVYLSYIEQAKQGAFLFKSLYAPESLGRFVHPVYVPIGWLARLFDLTAIHAHEVGKAIVTIISVWLIAKVAQGMTDNEKDARIATVTLVLGGGLGWILVVKQAMHGFFPPEFFVPDVASETFFFPTLLGGAHIPLSFSLLVYSLFHFDQDLNNTRPTWQTIMSTSLLLFIHPYFLPIIGLYAFLLSLLKQLNWRTVTRFALTYIPFVALALAPHLWNYFDDPYRRFFLQSNHLDIASPIQNLFAALPWLVFIIWRFRRLPFKAKEKWLFVWIITIIILLTLPFFHFKRKLLEGLGVGLILLALPVWLKIIAWAKKTGRIAHAGLWIFVILSPLCLLQSQISWVTKPLGRGDEFFVSRDLVDAWEWIKFNTSDNTVILPDTPWIGLWTAPNTLRPVWLAHSHETPNWEDRKIFLKNLFQEQDSERVQKLLKETNSQLLITSQKSTAEFIEEKAGMTWQKAAHFGEITLWKQK